MTVPRSSGRGQVEPLAALAAVLALTAGLTLYGGVLTDVLPASGDRTVPTEIAQSLLRSGHPSLAVSPGQVAELSRHLPPGWRANLTLASGRDTWTAGPRPPPDAVTTRRPVSVRHSPARVRPGLLTVTVWR